MKERATLHTGGARVEVVRVELALGDGAALGDAAGRRRVRDARAPAVFAEGEQRRVVERVECAIELADVLQPVPTISTPTSYNQIRGLRSREVRVDENAHLAGLHVGVVVAPHVFCGRPSLGIDDELVLLHLVPGNLHEGHEVPGVRVTALDALLHTNPQQVVSGESSRLTLTLTLTLTQGTCRG